MFKLVLLSLAVTIGVAAYFHQDRETCESRGGHYEYLESVTGGESTRVCISGDYIQDTLSP